MQPLGISLRLFSTPVLGCHGSWRTRMTTEMPLEITFRNLDHSDAVEAKAREKVAKLEQDYGRITSCRIMTEALNRQRTTGNLFHVTISVGVTCTQVMYDANPARHQANVQATAALRPPSIP